MSQARDAGARRIVLGLGGSGTNDAGAGMLAGLAGLADVAGLVDVAGLADAAGVDLSRFTAGGGSLRGCDPADLTWLPALRAQWAGTELVIASDVDSPLLGMHGASAGFAEQKGATAQQAQDLERCLGDFAAAATSACAADPEPALPDKPASLAGAGAAGGLGFGLFLLGATRVPGAQAAVDAVDLAARLTRSDVVVTGEGCFDWQSLRGKVVAGVARAATQVGTPVVVLAGQVLVGRREAQSIGVESAYAVARSPQEVTQALADPAGTLAARAERVARTWSRP
jgi:glycerate kinase